MAWRRPPGCSRGPHRISHHGRFGTTRVPHGGTYRKAEETVLQHPASSRCGRRTARVGGWRKRPGPWRSRPLHGRGARSCCAAHGSNRRFALCNSYGHSTPRCDRQIGMLRYSCIPKIQLPKSRDNGFRSTRPGPGNTGPTCGARARATATALSVRRASQRLRERL